MTNLSSVPAATAPWGSGQAIPGTPFRQLVSGEETGGRLVVLAADMPAGEHVAEHTHDLEDQITIVIAGTVGASVGHRLITLEAGSVAFLPRGVPHAQWNAGGNTAQVLEIYTPAGFEKVFERAGAKALAGEPLTPEDFTTA